MKIRLLLPLFLSFSLISCQTNNPELITHIVDGDFIGSEFVFPMNTVTQLRMYYQDQYDEVVTGFDNIVKNVSKEVDRYHNYSGINNLKTINDSCGTNQEIVISNELFDVLKEAIDLTILTKGKFNLAIGKLIDLYSDKVSEELSGTFNTLPDESILSDVLSGIPSYEDIKDVVVLNEENNTVTLNKYNGRNVIISLGAIAKGYVMQQAYEYLKVYNYPALFDAGSSTMGMIGEKPSNKDKNYNIVLNNPSLSDSSDTMLKLSLYNDHFISTSGDYNQYFFYSKDNEKKMMHHIIDPYTGVSNNYIRNVTLVSTDISMSILDALSTAIFNCYNDKEVTELISDISNNYNGSISYMICKPYYENSIKNYDKFNVLMSESFSLLINGNVSDTIIDTKII